MELRYRAAAAAGGAQLSPHQQGKHVAQNRVNTVLSGGGEGLKYVAHRRAIF